LRFLAGKLSVEYYEPKDDEVDAETLRAFPFHLGKKNGVLPLKKDADGKVVVIMADPVNGAALEDLRSYYPNGFKTLIGAPQKIIQLLEKHHQQSNAFETSRITLEITNTDDDLQAEIEAKKIQEAASGPKVIAAVNNIIVGAKKDGASDIHIEPYRENMRVRYRIDGCLKEKGSLTKSLHMPIVSRIKIMAGLNIAERRVPQDGRARVLLFGQPLDLRISTCPTQFGEKVVMRLLSKDNVKTIDALGFGERDSKLFIDIISKPNGIFLVTGPTGSGKSSTLYAGLMRINSPEINVMTIEDPVESELEGVNQVAVNPKQGLSFASVLRSALRQDPDVIMIGEIRDGETAEIAVRAAITGHMVLSTLHTNSAPGAVDRLKDMGLEPFMLASALKGVLAQRLVRLICPHCKQESSTENPFDIPLKKAFKGAGCEECGFSGHAGRIGIFEMLEINQDVRQLIHTGSGEDDLKRYMAEKKIPTMLEDGINKVEHGITTIDEVLRVTMED
jgi:type IV pilus assembly protein PilB